MRDQSLIWSILGLALFLMILAALLGPVPTKVEAIGEKRFQVQTTETIGPLYNLMAVCDTATGNLLYTGNDYRTGITVVPNGCQKNPK